MIKMSTFEETKAEYIKTRDSYKEKRDQLFKLQHDVEMLSLKLDELHDLANDHGWELIDNPIFSKEKIDKLIEMWAKIENAEKDN